jgi:uncharacterized metal-binding protein YceD (DUF177 family)
MKDLKEFTIPFVGLKLGKHQFDFELKKAFFEHFEYDEFDDADINLEVLLEKKNTFLEFTLAYQGFVNVACDVTNELYNQPISGDYKFVVNFGDEYNDDNEDLLVIPHGSYEVNIQQFIYESIVLAVPLRRVHPGIEDGSLESDILEKLEELSPNASDEEELEDNEVDPRWDTLKKLLTDK